MARGGIDKYRFNFFSSFFNHAFEWCTARVLLLFNLLLILCSLMFFQSNLQLGFLSQHILSTICINIRKTPQMSFDYYCLLFCFRNIKYTNIFWLNRSSRWSFWCSVEVKHGLTGFRGRISPSWCMSLVQSVAIVISKKYNTVMNIIYK